MSEEWITAAARRRLAETLERNRRAQPPEGGAYGAPPQVVATMLGAGQVVGRGYDELSERAKAAVAWLEEQSHDPMVQKALELAMMGGQRGVVGSGGIRQSPYTQAQADRSFDRAEAWGDLRSAQHAPDNAPWLRQDVPPGARGRGQVDNWNKEQTRMAANKLAAIKEGLKRQGAIDREAIDAARREAEIPGAFGSNPAATAVGGGAILGRDLGPRFAAWLRGEGEKR